MVRYLNIIRFTTEWQFNHNPVADKFSLTQRKGWLRLPAATVTDSILNAQNTLCQRVFGPHSEATVKMDISKMANGDKAGLMLLQNPNASLTIYRTAKNYQLQMTISNQVKSVQVIKSEIVYLRANVCGISDKVNFSYSLDGSTFVPFGQEFKMEFSLSIFCGNRYGLFNYATKKQGGWVDIDWMHVNQQPLFDRKNIDDKEVEAEYFNYQYKSKVRRAEQNQENLNQDVTFTDGGMIGFRNLNENNTILTKFELYYMCTSPNAVLEIRNIDTGTLLGTIVLLQTKGKYDTQTIDLKESLAFSKRVEFIVRKPDQAGIVTLDKFKFSK
jgi:hypothetical protein